VGTAVNVQQMVPIPDVPLRDPPDGLAHEEAQAAVVAGAAVRGQAAKLGELIGVDKAARPAWADQADEARELEQGLTAEGRSRTGRIGRG
jgi:hypothetical protein